MKPSIILAGISAVLASALAVNPSPTGPCTRTIFNNPGFNLDHTETIYATTVTKTAEVDCGGCVLTTLRLGPGPVDIITATTHLPATTTTTTICSPTPYGYAV